MVTTSRSKGEAERPPAIAADGRIRLERHAGRARALLESRIVAESEDALVLHERGYPPRFYFPQADVRMELLEPSGHRTRCPHKGEASYWSVHVAGRSLANGAWAYLEPLPEVRRIKGRISFDDAVRIEA